MPDNITPPPYKVPPAPIQVPAPVAPPRARHWLTPLLVTLFLAALTTTGLIFLRSQDLSRQLAAAQPSPTASATVTPSADPTSTWQTYTNTAFGFSFKYPPGWTIKKDVNDVSAYMQASDVTIKLDSVFYNSDKIHVLWIKKINNTANESLIQIIRSGILDKDYGTLSTSFGTADPKFKTTTINGYQIYEPDSNWPTAFGIKTAFIENPIDNSYSWINIEPYTDSSLDTTFAQILSTFKFTN